MKRTNQVSLLAIKY